MIAILIAFVLPFLLLILTLILKRDGEPSETDHASDSWKSNSANNTNNKRTKQKTSSHHRKSRDKRKFIFDWDANEFKSENETLYTAALCRGSLFVGDEEGWERGFAGNGCGALLFLATLHHVL